MGSRPHQHVPVGQLGLLNVLWQHFLEVATVVQQVSPTWVNSDSTTCGAMHAAISIENRPHLHAIGNVSYSLPLLLRQHWWIYTAPWRAISTLQLQYMNQKMNRFSALVGLTDTHGGESDAVTTLYTTLQLRSCDKLQGCENWVGIN